MRTITIEQTDKADAGYGNPDEFMVTMSFDGGSYTAYTTALSDALSMGNTWVETGIIVHTMYDATCGEIVDSLVDIDTIVLMSTVH